MAEQETITTRPRRTVATYPTYADAQRAVDYLSDEKFPVQRVAIVEEGLRLVEQGTGRMNYGMAALNGALSGAIPGLFFGFIFGLFSWIQPVASAFTLAFYGLIYGAIFGAIIGLISQALSGSERNFASVPRIDARHYSLVVDEEFADAATRMLANMRHPPRGPERAHGHIPEQA
jgi:hypothetical protein